MKLAHHNDRAVLVVDDGVADVEQASGGRFGPDVMALYDEWDAFAEFAAGVTSPTEALDQQALGNPAPRPRQVFAIGLNYRSHAEESGMALPAVPATFTKFPASLAGPFDDVELVGTNVDWEVELVAVVGRRADRVAEADGWSHIAGLTVGQDISDRDLALGCSVDGETVQDARTSDLIFDIPRLVAELSAVLPLLPGDVIFTGTPAGVGITRQPPRALQPGQVLETWVEGIGTIRNVCR